jgi:formate hydrogenlyase subunit 6/NADH:ubiquinone oxidoreductase subunit I
MNKTGKGVDQFNMDLGRCMFCGLCVEACTSSALKMGPGYEFAAYEKDGCMRTIEQLAEGGPENVRRNVETLTKPVGEDA